MKKLLIILCSMIVCFAFTLYGSASSFNTYADLSSSNSNGQNLLNLAMNYDSFENKDFVILLYC